MIIESGPDFHYSQLGSLLGGHSVKDSLRLAGGLIGLLCFGKSRIETLDLGHNSSKGKYILIYFAKS